MQWGQAGAQGRSRGSRGRGGEGERGEEGRAAARVEAEAEAEAGSGGEGGDGGGGKGGEKFWRGRGRFGAVIGRARAAGTMGEIGAPPGLEARTSPPPAECHQGSCPGGFCEWMHLVQTRQQAFGWCPEFSFSFSFRGPRPVYIIVGRSDAVPGRPAANGATEPRARPSALSSGIRPGSGPASPGPLDPCK